MNALFRVVSDRLKLIFTAHAALELEAELTTAHIARKADLLQQARSLQEQGLGELADEVRRSVSAMGTVIPLTDCPDRPALTVSGSATKLEPTTTEPEIAGPMPLPKPTPELPAPSPSPEMALPEMPVTPSLPESPASETGEEKKEATTRKRGRNVTAS